MPHTLKNSYHLCAYISHFILACPFCFRKVRSLWVLNTCFSKCWTALCNRNNANCFCIRLWKFHMNLQEIYTHIEWPRGPSLVGTMDFLDKMLETFFMSVASTAFINFSSVLLHSDNYTRNHSTEPHSLLHAFILTINEIITLFKKGGVGWGNPHKHDGTNTHSWIYKTPTIFTHSYLCNIQIKIWYTYMQWQ